MANIIVCDICNSRERVTAHYYRTGEWQTDPAGGRSEESREIYDLCADCELKILRHLFTELHKRSCNPSDKIVVCEKMIIEEIKRRISIKSLSTKK